MKTVVLGITGGIAAFKILELIPLLIQQNIHVEVMMTYGATKMVDPKKIEKLIGHHVYTNIFEEAINHHDIRASHIVEHIELAKQADLVVIAPATANILAKLAQGIADDYITTTVLAARSPVLICPSMNTVMWKNPLTQKNVASLHNLGFLFLKPEVGLLACGENGEGRLVSLESLLSEILSILNKRSHLKGKKIIVTAGGTREFIDDVRFITNKSSGKMGCALAEVAFLQGADVLFIRAKNAVSPRYPIKEKIFESADELDAILRSEVPTAKICFHTAAVSDYSLKEKYKGKLSSLNRVSLTLIPREKILFKIKSYNPHIFLIAFKAAWNISEEQLISISKEKLEQSHADIIIANDIGKKDRGFDVDTNEVYIIHHDTVIKLSLNSKKVIAEQIFETLAKII